jgi:hypothetical protein
VNEDWSRADELDGQIKALAAELGVLATIT